MSSTFFGLNISYSGLLASNAALNTTANNIANVQTNGYSKQQVEQTAANPMRVFQTYGCAGAGVQTLAIERIRDDFYDQKYWNNNANVGEYDMKSYYMKELEGYFYDDGANAGFSSVYNQLMITGLEELMKDPSSTSLKSQLVGYAGALTDYFNGVYGNLQALQKDVNSEIKLKIDQINSIASEISSLNTQINTVEMSGQNANELRDRRTVLLDELSEIVDVKVTETALTDPNDPTRETGGTRFIVKIAGGQTLVDANVVNELVTVARDHDEKVNQTDIDGLYDIYWSNNGQKFNLGNAAMGGALRGLVEMRDGNNGENFNGTVTAVKPNSTIYGEDGKLLRDEKGNPDYHDTVTIQVTDLNLTDLNKCNLSDQGGIISLGNQEFYYDSWEFSYDASADTYSYTFVLSNDTEKNPTHVSTDRIGQIGEIGSNIDYQGIPYYMSQMNEWARAFAAKFNDLLQSGNAVAKTDVDGNPILDADGNKIMVGQGTSLFSADRETDKEQYQFTTKYGEYADATTSIYDIRGNLASDGDGNYTVRTDSDSYYRLTAENFSVLSAMSNDPSLLVTRRNENDGVEQNDLLEDLKQMSTDSSVLSFRGTSANEFLQQLLTDVAMNASSANVFQSSYENIQQSIDTKRLSISGVDEDEEAVDLVKFQNAYNLSAKMISVFTEIYNKLINETGV